MPPKKKTAKKSTKTKPPFAPLKAKKGFVAVQIVVAVSPKGDVGTHTCSEHDDDAYEALDCARANVGDYGREGERERQDAVIHLVEIVLPIPKRPMLKKAKARTKKVAGPKAEAPEAE